MGAAEIKIVITDYISKIDDVSFLSSLMKTLEAKVSEREYVLDEEQVQRLSKARQDFVEGNVTEHVVVEEKVRKWLNTK